MKKYCCSCSAHDLSRSGIGIALLPGRVKMYGSLRHAATVETSKFNERADVGRCKRLMSVSVGVAQECLGSEVSSDTGTNQMVV